MTFMNANVDGYAWSVSTNFLRDVSTNFLRHPGAVAVEKGVIFGCAFDGCFPPPSETEWGFKTLVSRFGSGDAPQSLHELTPGETSGLPPAPLTWKADWGGTGTGGQLTSSDTFTYERNGVTNEFNRVFPAANGYAPPPFVDLVSQITTNDVVFAAAQTGSSSSR